MVAVPVNYGMLSYTHFNAYEYGRQCRSPRQLWNALLPKGVDSLKLDSMSQSPSIMECSPTLGPLSSRTGICRSPRQLWNALLHDWGKDDRMKQ